MQREGRNVGCEIVPVVGETTNLDAAAGGALDHGLDPHADQVLKPGALHDDKAGNHKSDRERGQGGQTVQGYSGRLLHFGSVPQG